MNLMKINKYALAGITIALLAAGCNSSGNQTSSNSNGSSGPTTAPGTKLSDEPYAKYTYEINPANLSAAAKQATLGFNISSQTLTSGDTKITLDAISNPEYHSQSYELKPGQKLYFVEKNTGDDTPQHDNFPADDSAVIVDQNGYVVSQ